MTSLCLRFSLALLVNCLLAAAAVHLILAAVDLNVTVHALQAIVP